MAYLLQRTRVKGRKIPDFLITLGSGTPSVVIALGLIMTMNGKFGINLYNTAAIMIIAYLIKYLMMGMRTVVSAMSQIHVSLEESSQISGASWLGTMRRITVPLLAPTSLFLFVTTFIASMKVFQSVDVMTGGGPGTATNVMVQWIYNLTFKDFRTARGAAVSLVFFVILLVCTVATMRFSNKNVNYDA